MLALILIIFVPLLPSLFVPGRNCIIMSHCWKSYSEVENNIYKKKFLPRLESCLAKWKRWTDKTRRVFILVQSLLFTLTLPDPADALESSLLSLALRGQNMKAWRQSLRLRGGCDSRALLNVSFFGLVHRE